MKPLLLVTFAISVGVCIGVSIGALLPASSPSVTAKLDITELQSMVREAATFGWRCHEHGSEAECTLAVMRVIGGGK